MTAGGAAETGGGRLAGRRILIVGAGQQSLGLENPPVGNGRAMAVLFAHEGASLVLADVDATSLQQTDALVRERGAQCLSLVVDASQESEMHALFQQASSALGGLDGLVMNVGIAVGNRFAGTSVEDWDRVMAVNLRSHFLGCKHALATFSDGGAIVLVGSLAAREAMPIPAYAASKAALEAVCRNAAIEGAPTVRVNVLAPGLIDTALGRLAGQYNPAPSDVHIPAGRHGSAWEVARSALFLISSDASYVTGQTLVVDGGLSVAARG
jgi:NAD(P)-dependent dehydrogenase (short-subunit alcohol dehydrogenase family)